MIPTFAQGLRLSASSLEAAGARRRVRKAPLTIDAAYDFIDSFKYGKIHLVPTQVRQEMTAFLELIAANPPHTVVELGTNRGGTLFLLTRVAAPDASIVSVDLGAGPFGGGYPRSWGSVFKAFARDRQSLQLVRGDSHAPATLQQIESIVGRSVDLLFIDGDHTYEGVKNDYEMYSPLVRKGGLIGFHDIVDGPPENVGGVPRYWREVRGEGFQELVADREQGGYGIGVLTKA